MASSAPGVNISVSASAASARNASPTGVWFVAGTANGPSGIAVPIASMSDFTTYFGAVVNTALTGRYSIAATPNSGSSAFNIDSTKLYDALDVYFREGGVQAYVSRMTSNTNYFSGVATSSSSTSLTLSTATWTVNQFAGQTVTAGASTAVVVSNTSTVLTVSAWTGGTPTSTSAFTVNYAPATVTVGKITLNAVSTGSWANFTSNSSGPNTGLQATVTGPYPIGSNNSYIANIIYNGMTMATSPALGGEQDICNWVNSLPNYQALCTATYVSSGTTAALPTVLATPVAISLAGGADYNVVDADLDKTLSAFVADFGAGQISYPGGTSAANYSMLTAYAQLTNRVAILDGADTATAATLTTAVSTLQTTAGLVLTKLGSVYIDASYAGMFAPWVKIPGITQTNPNQITGLVFNRTVAPSALAAAKMAQNDQANDCNVTAAGVGPGTSSYATGVTQAYNANDRGVLNSGGVNVIRNVPNVSQIAIYGSRSCANDANWVFLNNCRFRMQVIRELDIIAESFVFDEIDGRGQIFARLNGALAGQCQTYWVRRSIYGTDPSSAFQVNTGATINTPATIAAGQINAQVGLRMSPFGEFINISVTKYAANASLPSYTNNFAL
jgi:hypothetical protein